MGTMGDDKGWNSRVGKPIQDLVPPAANRGDPLPPESMKLREELIRKDRERIRKKREAEAEAARILEVPVLPVDPEDEKIVDELLMRVRGKPASRPIYGDVRARALRLPRDERLDVIVALVESLRAIPDSPSGEGGE